MKVQQKCVKSNKNFISFSRFTIWGVEVLSEASKSPEVSHKPPDVWICIKKLNFRAKKFDNCNYVAISSPKCLKIDNRNIITIIGFEFLARKFTSFLRYWWQNCDDIITIIVFFWREHSNSILHWNLDKVTRSGEKSCYFSENYFIDIFWRNEILLLSQNSVKS